jgi:hypothetical protein
LYHILYVPPPDHRLPLPPASQNLETKLRDTAKLRSDGKTVAQWQKLADRLTNLEQNGGSPDIDSEDATLKADAAALMASTGYTKKFIDEAMVEGNFSPDFYSAFNEVQSIGARKVSSRMVGGWLGGGCVGVGRRSAGYYQGLLWSRAAKTRLHCAAAASRAPPPH